MFCYKCNRIYAGDDVSTVIAAHPEHNGDSGMEFPGIYIQTDFISPKEEKELMNGIDKLKWDASQSGRRKQVNNQCDTQLKIK